MKQVGVQFRDVRLSYGRTHVLKGVSLDIAPGEFFALLGPSGSGKSSLLRLLAGFHHADRGQLLVDGVDVGSLPPWRRNVGMVFQNYALWPHLNVHDNVAFGLVERRLPKGEIASRVGAALETVGLSALAQRRPSQLSGGQQQRVALARTIVIEPQVLLLDEPLSNLDKSLRVQMRQELLALQRRLSLTTIFVTHDQEEAMTTADRLAVLDEGVLQQTGTPAALYDAPANLFVAGFVGTMNRLPGRVRERAGTRLSIELDGLAAWALDAPAAPAGDAVAVCTRPHALRIQPAEGRRDAALRWLEGRIESAEFVGAFTRYRVLAGAHSVAVDQPHHAGLPIWAAGAAVAVGVDPAQVLLFPADG